MAFIRVSRFILISGLVFKGLRRGVLQRDLMLESKSSLAGVRAWESLHTSSRSAKRLM
jgi:hypothetical protein